MPTSEHIYYLGFGSNLGERELWLERTLHALKASVNNTLGRVLRVSAPYYNPAHVLEGDSSARHPDYLNVVIEFHSTLDPLELLAHLQSIERSLGRDRLSEKRWDNRTVDLDIVACDDLVLDRPELVLPHPRMHLRDFVLIPLLEIARDWRHPILKKNVRELVALLPCGTTLAVAAANL